MNKSRESFAGFTGRRRPRKTRRRVHYMDRVARTLITLGGIGTIVAVSAVCIFLVWVVVPLFLPSSVVLSGDYQVSQAGTATGPASPLPPERLVCHVDVDEHLTMGWSLFRDGSLVTFRLATGEVLQTRHPFGDSPPTCWSFSVEGDQCAFGFADGSVSLGQIGFQVEFVEQEGLSPSFRELALGAAAVTDVVIAPKEDAVFAVTRNTVRSWELHAPHGGITLASIFQPVWYEGYEHPEHAWQSSSGTDDFEPKYGLYPLIFGTLKATVYCLLFAVPLALLAAIYTSEFLHPRLKNRVKPAIEMMASLPSVVLGFLAALVLAPFVENLIPEVIAVAFVTPVAFVFAGYLWQLWPRAISVKLERLRFLCLFGVIPVAMAVAGLVARPLERVLFAGDLKSWLDGQVGTGTGGWMLICIPVSGFLVALCIPRFVDAELRRVTREWSHWALAGLDLLKCLVWFGLTVGLALGIAWALTLLGLDPRGGLLGTYIQRNALIVGFVMGFVVIPIIYTIAEDALSAVPDHLRAASLAAGATPWQTTIRIILPTAMSGLFSAVMVGLGRAVGETMIVLMAAGNTPITQWNIFSGFRTLSANIAVELPEAVQNSTHYRMLFLAALALFAMTFVINTMAEVVRLRFRRRAFEL